MIAKSAAKHSKTKGETQKVAHAQPSEAAQQRYDQLCLSIREHAANCVAYVTALMKEMWTMAEEVHELKSVCGELGKPYERDAIRLCGGETAFHYVRDLYTAFDGDREKAMESGKAPYTILREFRKRRAEKNRQAKASTAKRIKKPAPLEGTAARIAEGPKDEANGESEKVLIPPLTTPKTATATVDSACDGTPKQYGDQLSAALATIKGLVDDPWETLLEVINALDLNWADVAAWAKRRAERDAAGPVESVDVHIDTTHDEFVEV